MAEGVGHVFVAAEVGHDAQLDLRIVGRKEDGFGVVSGEGFADLAAQFLAHGDVLQVRVRRTQSAGRGHRLVERGVDLTRCRVYALGQGVDVGAEQLLDPSVVEQLADDGVFAA